LNIIEIEIAIGIEIDCDSDFDFDDAVAAAIWGGSMGHSRKIFLFPSAPTLNSEPGIPEQPLSKSNILSC